MKNLQENAHKFTTCLILHSKINKPFPSFSGPLFQNEDRCSAFDIEIMFHSQAKKTHFHKKSSASSLILKVRVFGTQKWPSRLRNLVTDERQNQLHVYCGVRNDHGC